MFVKMKLAVLVIAVLVCFAGCENKSNKSDVPDTSDTFTLPAVTTEASVSVTETPVTTETVSETEAPSNDTTLGIVQTAQALIGIPFSENGSSPESGFDNSGFIYYVLHENGLVTWPRSITEQVAVGSKIGFDKLNPGDLIYFSDDDGEPSFGGIYVGDGKMIACLMPGQNVKEVDVTTSYYQKNFYTGISFS